VEFGLLGPLLIRNGDTIAPTLPPRLRALMAALLLSAGRVIEASELAEAVWNGDPPPGGRAALHTAVQRLRSALGPDGRTLIRTQPPGYLLELDPGTLDVRQFAALTSRGQASARAGQWADAASDFAGALALWRGEPLADVPSQLLRAREVPYLAEQRLEALAARIEADLNCGDPGPLVGELRRLVTVHPLREGFHAQLMLALCRTGRQADALAAYQDLRRVLADELGVDPSPDLQRLHQRILRGDVGGKASEHTKGAADGEPGRKSHAPGIPRQLPPAGRHFCGRDNELLALTGLLAETTNEVGAVVVAAIDGPPGIGKTALALHFAHQVAASFPDGQLHVNLRGFDPSGRPVHPSEAIRGFLDALGVEPRRVPVRLAEQAALYRSLLAGKRVLVVLDNARDAAQVRPLLPGSRTCMVVVTSRSQLTSLVAAEGAQPLTLGLPSADEAREMLARRLGADRISADRQAADELIGLCARLPLALSIAAARAAGRPGFRLSAVIDELREAHDGVGAMDAGDPATNVAAVFSWSYARLSDPSARLFRLLGLYPGPDIPAAGCASLAGVPPGVAYQAVGELTRANLASEHAPGRLAVHDLLRAYAAGQARALDTEADRQAAACRLLDYYLHTACAADRLLDPGDQLLLTLHPAQTGVTPECLADRSQALAWFKANRRVLVAAVRMAADAGLDTHAWQIAQVISRFLEWQGQRQDWAAVQRLALTAAQRSDDAVGQANAHRQLGSGYAQQGSHADGQTHLLRALDLFHQLGDEARQASTLNAMGVAASGRGRYDEALGYAGQALEKFRSAGSRAGEARALNGIGWCHAHLGDYQQALAYCGQALDLHRLLGSRRGEASTLHSLGYAHQHVGQHGKAIACYRAAAGVYGDVGEHFLLADTLACLGDAHRAAGDLQAARAAWWQALEMLDDLNHPDANRVRGRLADLTGVPGDAAGTRPQLEPLG
jgi:DNA-binding SARP family transcriptional activator/tetratricopeptide (TPR) repeat protein